MGLKLDCAALDSAFYRLRQRPDDAGARAELLEQFRPFLHAFAAPCALTSASVVRLVEAAERALGAEFDGMVAGWFLCPKGREARLLRRARRAVEFAVLDLPADSAVRIEEDDLNLAPLVRVRQRGRERLLLDILSGVMVRARQHFDQPNGQRLVQLAERCIRAIVVDGSRPAWNPRGTRAWGSDVREVRGVYGLCAVWTREMLAEHIHEVLA